MILAGDIGGTKSNLALFAEERGSLRLVYRHRIATRDYPGFEELVEAFLQQAAAAHQNFNRASIKGAGFGVAGVVTGGRHYSENLPWILDVSALDRDLGLKNVQLLNDLAATALGLNRLAKEDLVSLNPGTPVPNATQGVIAAGTGLGEALLFWNGQRRQVAPAEGGMADFSPRTERESQLLTHLRGQLPHVCCEDIVSGRGFRRIHEFLNPSVRHESFESAEGNTAGEIVQRALAKSCLVCEETLDFWIEIFGGVTGNFALHSMALGGIFIAGGIAVKTLPELQRGTFYKAFCRTGKLAGVMERVPIAVVVNEDAPVLGAAYEALGHLQV